MSLKKYIHIYTLLHTSKDRDIFWRNIYISTHVHIQTKIQIHILIDTFSSSWFENIIFINYQNHPIKYDRKKENDAQQSEEYTPQ